jgi:hypothetical protein
VVLNLILIYHLNYSLPSHYLIRDWLSISQGDLTLADYIKDRNFPSNLESVMFGRVLQGVDSSRRNALIIKQIMRQIITSLKKIHDVQALFIEI